MFQRLLIVLLGLAAAASVHAQDAAKTEWKEGQHYFLIDPPVATATPGKVEVLEAFSYACPHCAHFQPFADQIKAKLPKQATFAYLPVVFNPSWEPFARAFYAAQSMNVLDKTHQALFDALHKDRQPLRSIEEIGKFFATLGVDEKTFLSTAKSFVVEGNLATGQKNLGAYGIDSTPTIIVNGKYRLNAGTAGGFPQAAELTGWLVAKEIAAKK
ncbi:MAG TPA: thiol:disulfide interchange protein DsbA/DsbL [Tahibacter sp.]|nr:thiol:disulfide interchange protein DsbA/DsbL [Tahibacter sp.]